MKRLVLLSSKQRLRQLMLAFITLMGIGNANAQVIYSEGFDGTFPPTNWTSAATVGTMTWTRVTSSTNVTAASFGGGAGFLRYNCYNNINVGDRAVLITPVFDLSGKTSSDTSKVKFAMHRDGGFTTYPDTLSVYVNTSASLTGAVRMAAIPRVNSQAPTGSVGWNYYTLNIPASFSGTANYVIFEIFNGYGNNMYLDSITYMAFPTTSSMTYDSSTTAHTTTAIVPRITNQNILRMKVSTSGTVSPLTVTNFSLSTNGSTNPSTDIDSARIYYTGNSSTFATTNRFGAIISPNGSFSISGTRNLAAGDNYFWLVYDIKATATVDNVIDAECSSITISSVSNTPTVTAPSGSRTIKGPMSGTYTVGSSSAYPNLTTFMTDLSALSMGGNTTLSITSNITEPASVIIPQWAETGGSGYRLRIEPSTVDTIFANAASGGVIALAGADRVTIDGRIGGTGNNLAIINTSTTAAQAGILIASAGTGAGCLNDTIRNLNIMCGTSSAGTGMYGIQVQGDNNHNVKLLENSISRGAYGINVVITNSPSGVNTGLVISGNSIGGNVANRFLTKGGINVSGSYGAMITQNYVYNIMDVPGNGTNIYGIQVGSYSARTVISRNIVDSTYNPSSGAWGAWAIALQTSTLSDSVEVLNNKIGGVGDVNYSTTSTTYNPFGLYINGGARHKIYYNSVNMYGPAITNSSWTTSGTLSAALLVIGTSSLLDVRNNIFANGYVGLSGSNSYAVYTSITNPFANINNNDYYASGTYGVLGYIGGSNKTTIGAWRTATGQDGVSFSANPSFTSPTDLTIGSGSTPSQLESGGASLTGYNIDFNGDARPKTSPTTNGGNTLPDIGAFEFDGAPIDLIPPAISYTALTNISSTTNRALTSFATITDATGIDTVSGTNPRIYFKKRSDANAFVGNTSSDNGWKWVETSSTASPFSFTIDYSIINGGSVATGDTVQYFVVAQDRASAPNITANPSTGFAGTNVSTISAAPTTPNQYVLTPNPLAGNYTVGVAQNYTTLTAAVSDLNLRGVSSAVSFSLTDTVYSSGETFPIVINQVAGASLVNDVKILPAAGNTAIIRGTNSTALIKLNGADYITFNGSNNNTTSQDLTIENFATGPVIWISSLGTGQGATNNTLRNMQITGGTIGSGSYGIMISGLTAVADGAGNSKNAIINNRLRKMYSGIFIRGVSGVTSDSIVISRNRIGSDTSAMIVDNRGIDVARTNALTITENLIYNMVSTSTQKVAIELNGEVTNSRISKNTIRRVEFVSTGSGYGARGISISTGSGNNNVTIDNNMISGVLADGWGTGYTWSCIGILINGGANYNIYYNTVHLSGLRVNSGTSHMGVCLWVDGSATGLNIRNNIFTNNQSSTNSVVGTNYAVYSTVGSGSFSNINYNLYRSTTPTSTSITPYIGSISATNAATLANWRTATSQDAQSASTLVNYVDTTYDLHLTGASIGDYALKGTSISGFTQDIDNETRPTVPYMGADEIPSSPLPVVLSIFTAVASGDDAVLRWTTASELNNSHFVIERSMDGDRFGAIAEVNGSGTSNSPRNYSYTDAGVRNMGTAKVFYRLKQVDFDGRSAAGEMRNVLFDIRSTVVIAAYPNTFKSDLALVVKNGEEGTAIVDLHDLQGRKILSRNAEITNTNNTIVISGLQEIPSGLYFVRVNLNGTTTAIKVIKE